MNGEKRIDRKRIAMLLGVIGAAGTLIAAQAPADKQLVSKNFRVEIDGVDAGAFQSVEGVGVALEVLEAAPLPGDPVVRKIPGRLKYGNVTLKRGVVGSSDFFDFFDQVRQGADPNVRKDISITYLEPDGTEIQTINYSECFLQSYSLGPLDAKPGTDVLRVEVTFTCDYFVIGVP